MEDFFFFWPLYIVYKLSKFNMFKDIIILNYFTKIKRLVYRNFFKKKCILYKFQKGS